MSQRIINFLIYLTIFCLPLYLVRFKIDWIPFNVLEFLICLLFLIWLFRGNKNQLLFRNRFWWPILLIFFGLTISVLFSSDLETSAGIWKSWFLAPLLFWLVLINQLRDKEQIKKVFWSLFFSGVAVALISLFCFFTDRLTYDNRLAGFYNSANYLAMYLAPILILSFYLYSFTKNKKFKILLVTGYCLLVTVIYLTYSYGAWLGVLAAFLFILIKRKRIKITIIFILLIIVVLMFQVSSFKFQGMLDLSYPSLKSRLVIWQVAGEIIKDNFLIGIGPGMFQKYYSDYQAQFPSYPEWAVPHPHNLFLAFWLQTGLLGLIGFIWLLFLFFKKTDPKGFLGSVLMAAMIYLLAHGLIDTTYWKNDLSIIFWLITA
ncbi:MAG: O-antigen ligase family protein, partial [Patescibacteria group bacterium]